MGPALRLTLFRLACVPALLASAIAFAQPVQTEHVEAELIAERTALVPGEDNWIALELTPERGWHTYWRNPGDSGIPTNLRWHLPEGFVAGEILWPFPERHSLGEVVNYGYGETTLHLVPLTVPRAAAPGDVTLKAKAKWLVCNPEICIPGEAEVELKTKVASEAKADPDHVEAFARARAHLPAKAAWSARFATDEADFSMALTADEIAGAKSLDFYPYAKDLVTHAAPQRQAREGNTLRLSQGLSSFFVSAPTMVDGVVVLDGKRAFEISARPGEVAVVSAGESRPADVATSTPAGSSPGLLLALLLAIAGGLILNLMPCVFPVLSLKALAVLEAHDGRERGQAIAYTAGVVLSFVLVAGAMLALRAGGQALGWGFQLQSPVFIAALAYLFFAMALSLSGLAEIGLRFMGMGQSLTQSGGLGGSFFTGVLAAVVASPCVAPFMGTALGYAMTQSAPIALLVFGMLGLGLALPFLLMGFFPVLARWLPRPGAWMETFRQLMAFPLYLTVVWLIWVLDRQSGADAAALIAVGLVTLAMTLWMRRFEGVFARVVRWAFLIAALGLLAHPAVRTPAATTKIASARAAEPYSEERLAELRKAGRTIFVNFTADWCLTCKVNEKAVLGRESMREEFRKRNVAELMGDWTSPDPVITQALARFGRSGVPLYLVYRDGGEPRVLPQILTQQIVIEALDAPKE
jgi:thiol:disulfide interchange protein